MNSIPLKGGIRDFFSENLLRNVHEISWATGAEFLFVFKA